MAGAALLSHRLYEPGAVKRAVASGQVAAGQIAAGRIDVEAWHDASTPEARRGAERLLYRSLRKPVDGFIARNVNRHVSLAVTRLIIGTGITPNMMTVVANAVGALGVWFVAQATWTSIAIGAFLVQMQSILDGCDGELARLKFKSSRFGEWFDNVLDDSVNVAFGAALGHATSVLTGQTIWWWLGLGAAAGFTLYNVMVYLQLALVHKTGNPFAFRWWFQKGEADLAATLARPGAANRLAELSRAIARRDVFLFCYMLLAFVRLPQVAVGWYAAIASVTVVTSLMHVMMGGMRRPNAPATQEQHVERKVEAR
jgi:phosphatidylglycerophosphate synthase